jgi:hypothetical protein
LLVKAPIRRAGLLSVAAIGVLIGSAVTLTDHGDVRSSQIVKADFVTATLLKTSVAPAKDLQELHEPAWLETVRGEPPWCAPLKRLESPAYSAFFYGISHQKIAAFLANHPLHTYRVLDSAADAFYQPRPMSTLCSAHPDTQNTPNLANFSRAPHTKPQAIDHRFTPITSTLTLLRGAGLAPLVLLWFAPAAAALIVLCRRPRHESHGLAIAALLLLGIAVLQFLVSAFGDGIDTPKHLNLAIYATAAAWAVQAAASVLSMSPRAAARPGEFGRPNISDTWAMTPMRQRSLEDVISPPTHDGALDIKSRRTS